MATGRIRRADAPELSAAAKNRAAEAAVITLGALALLAGLHFLPRTPDLAPLDFVSLGPGSLQFCDPLNPRFLAVTELRQPVTLSLRPDRAPRLGEKVTVAAVLGTATGKTVGIADLAAT